MTPLVADVLSGVISLLVAGFMSWVINRQLKEEERAKNG